MNSTACRLLPPMRLLICALHIPSPTRRPLAVLRYAGELATSHSEPSQDLALANTLTAERNREIGLSPPVGFGIKMVCTVASLVGHNPAASQRTDWPPSPRGACPTGCRWP